jgi:hypothetical protein
LETACQPAVQGPVEGPRALLPVVPVGQLPKPPHLVDDQLSVGCDNRSTDPSANRSSSLDTKLSSSRRSPFTAVSTPERVIAAQRDLELGRAQGVPRRRTLFSAAGVQCVNRTAEDLVDLAPLVPAQPDLSPLAGFARLRRRRS